MKYIYKINYRHQTLPGFDIEADAYVLEDGYFHFKEMSQGARNGIKVASVRAADVFNVERTDNETAE